MVRPVCAENLEIQGLLDGKSIGIGGFYDSRNVVVTIDSADRWLGLLSRAKRLDIRFRDGCNSIITVRFNVSGTPKLDF